MEGGRYISLYERNIFSYMNSILMILQIVVLVMMVYVLSTSVNKNPKSRSIVIDKENTKEMSHLNKLRQISLSVPLTEKSRPSTLKRL